MSRLGQRDTGPERALRSELHRRGLRFRVHRAPVKGIRSRADLVFGPAKTAIYVDGCFWHSCPMHGTVPKSNGAFWSQKLARNRERDREIDRALREQGWAVRRVWEHEDPAFAAKQIERLVRSRRHL
jgi:DNA mismatch endonuclease (patch repair protein)